MKRYIKSSTYDKYMNYNVDGQKYAVHYAEYDTSLDDGVEFVSSLRVSMSPIHPYDNAEYPWVVVRSDYVKVYISNGMLGTNSRTYNLFEGELPDSVVLWDKLDEMWKVTDDDYYKEQFESVLDYCASLIVKYSKDVKSRIDRS